MIVPANVPLAADRFTPFRTTLVFTGVDLTGATLESHIRTQRDLPGDPLVDLDTVGSISTEGLYIAGVVEVDGVDVSTISMHIDEATLEGFPKPGEDAGGELGDNLTCYWDIQIAPSGGLKQVYAAGEFILRSGVTQPAGWS